MEPNVLKKNWYDLANELKERWSDLTQSDLYYIEADKDRLIRVVERRRHITTQEARADVDDFLSRLNYRQTADPW